MTNITKIDKRKNYFLVVDTETLDSLAVSRLTDMTYKQAKPYNQKVVNIGYAVCDKKGNVYQTGSFLVKEFKHLLNAVYYSDKVAIYNQLLEDGKIEWKSYSDIINEMMEMISMYNIKNLCAYNLGFDKRVMQQTWELLHDEPFPLYKNVQMFDIYHVACQLLLNRPTYKWLAEKNGQMTDKGNYSTGAEACYRYIKGDWNFVEEHTALSDVLIEVEILSYCFRQKKSFDKSIKIQSWRIVNSK